jgi:hypothetical protein
MSCPDLVRFKKVHIIIGRHLQGLYLSPGIEESWKAETRRRVADIQAGKVRGIPGPGVSAQIRKVVGH